MGTKSLRQMSDTQFTAWLRGLGARGDIGVIKVGPGELMIPIEERVRVLNDLERLGVLHPERDGHPVDGEVVDRHDWSGAGAPGRRARAPRRRDAAVADLGELDPRVNMRASIHGLLELVELLRGAVGSTCVARTFDVCTLSYGRLARARIER